MFKVFITSSAEKSISASAKLAEKLGTGLEISRLPGTERLDSDFDAILKDLKTELYGFNGDVTFHALFSGLSPASKDSAIMKIVEKRFQQSFTAGKLIKAENIVFHSGNRGMKNKPSDDYFVEHAISFWKEFIKRFEDDGIHATLENVSEYYPQVIKTVVDEVNSPYLNLTLDTGHANLTCDIDVSDWIKYFGKKLTHMHLHNNFKTNDDHAGFNFGTINFLRVFKTLKDENITPLLVLEIFNREQLIESLDIMKKFIPV